MAEGRGLRGGAEGRHTEAIPIYKSVVALQDRHGADKPDDLLHSLWHLSRSLEATEQWGELVCVQERLLAVRARQHGEVSAETASDAHRLGATLLRLGRLPEAEAAFQRCLRIEEQVYGPERGELDMTLYRLGEVHIRQGTHHCALPILERCLRIEIRDQPEAASTGLTMELVALCLAVAGDEHAAQALLLRGLRLVERELGAENYRVLRMRARLVLMGAG